MYQLVRKHCHFLDRKHKGKIDVSSSKVFFFTYKPFLQAIHVIFFPYFLVKNDCIIPFLLINILNYWVNINKYFNDNSDAYEQKTHTHYSKGVSGILLFNGIGKTSTDD